MPAVRSASKKLKKSKRPRPATRSATRSAKPVRRSRRNRKRRTYGAEHVVSELERQFGDVSMKEVPGKDEEADKKRDEEVTKILSAVPTHLKVEGGTPPPTNVRSERPPNAPRGRSPLSRIFRPVTDALRRDGGSPKKGRSRSHSPQRRDSPTPPEGMSKD